MKTTLEINSIHEFRSLLENNKIKFTPAQKKIVDKLFSGYKIIIVNQHRANGGEWMWLKDGSESPECAGSVYKAFWGVVYSVRNATDETISMKWAISSIDNMKY